MSLQDRELFIKLEKGLLNFHDKKGLLLGIENQDVRQVFVLQLIDSIHRIRYISLIRNRDISLRRTDPNDQMFDPLKAAIIHQRNGDIDEACWLIFLFVHFGKHPRGGWRYLREVYGKLGCNQRWDWITTSNDISGFRYWLSENQQYIRYKDEFGGFGNHRKYESLDGDSLTGTGAIVESYVDWILSFGSHGQMITSTLEQANNNKYEAFDILYKSMNVVKRFGRLARFDYLTMLGKLSLANIEPKSIYIQGATGPLKGAQLLFGIQGKNQKILTQIDTYLLELDNELQVGMQVLEDALCNWQKNPNYYEKYLG